MSYILVVFQIIAGASAGWTSLGEFSSEERCLQAADQLAKQPSSGTVKRFDCLKK